MPDPSVVRHHFTVDVEEYFHPVAMEPFVPRASWPGFERRSPAVIERLLLLLEEHRAVATFFTLGWLAEREPGMVRAIAAAGHEVASHSWEHARVTKQTQTEFRESLRRSKAVLEDVSGTRVRGFRAPSFSIVPGVEWAFDVLLDEGYEYDSSLFPITQHPSYGYPGTPKDPYRIRRADRTIVEVPPATLRALGSTLPASGGAYLRFFPFAFVRGALRQAQRRGCSATFYIHPWELDDHVPDLPMTLIPRVRTFSRLGDTWARVRALLREFRFERIDRTLAAIDSSVITLA
jgi:polysaccharide deacetylase family protein (PEP-CTERM system associated)